MMILDKCFLHLTFFRQLSLIFNFLHGLISGKKNSTFLFKYLSNHKMVYLTRKFISTLKEAAVAESCSFPKVLVLLTAASLS